jgi:hypothetical protein
VVGSGHGDDTTTDTTVTDLAAIAHVVATLEHAQQNEPPEEFVGLFRPDAIWTTGGGRRLFGRDDIAAVKVRQRPVTLDGAPIADQVEGSPMYVKAKEDGAWLLAACQNTAVVGS